MDLFSVLSRRTYLLTDWLTTNQQNNHPANREEMYATNTTAVTPAFWGLLRLYAYPTDVNCEFWWMFKERTLMFITTECGEWSFRTDLLEDSI